MFLLTWLVGFPIGAFIGSTLMSTDINEPYIVFMTAVYIIGAMYNLSRLITD